MYYCIRVSGRYRRIRRKDYRVKKIESHQIGEFISISISAILIGFITIYLIVNIVSTQSSYITIEANAVYETAVSHGTQYVMPIEIKNKSAKTANFVRVELSEIKSGEKRDIDVDYLGSNSTRTVYTYYDYPIKRDDIQMTPSIYKLK